MFTYVVLLSFLRFLIIGSVSEVKLKAKSKNKKTCTVYLDRIQNSYKSMTNIYFLLLSFLSNTIEISEMYHLSSFNIKQQQKKHFYIEL